MKTRTRYAPSPTGHLHIGGARTALFNYLLAKHEGGDFIIRIEDTDIKRNIEGGEKNQIDNLEWLGIISDENPIKGGNFAPYRQIERLDIYNKYIKELLDKKIAYECWCSTNELNEYRKEQKNNGVASPKYSGKCANNPEPKKGMVPTIRMRVPKNGVFTWNDGVRGKIDFPAKDVGDWVIRKSNGIPTYNFAVVIDDHLMEITNILRGEEHISNTPKQIHLFNSFGWNIPNFSHLSIITGKDKKKLSKRDESTLQFIHLYKEQGFLPEAIFNFLSLLGWSPKGEEEIFSKEKLIKIFDKKRFSKAPSFFDINKLLWINNYYIKNLNKEELINFLSPFVNTVKLLDEQRDKIFKIFQPQLKKGSDISELISLFIEDISFKDRDIIFAKNHKKTIELFVKKLKNIESWEQASIREVLMSVGEDLNINGKNLMMPIRIAATGKTHGPDIAGTLKLFEKEKTLKRLENFINEN